MTDTVDLETDGGLVSIDVLIDVCKSGDEVWRCVVGVVTSVDAVDVGVVVGIVVVDEEVVFSIHSVKI